MAGKIYSETFITSKNPTEWSFTWIAFNNNPSILSFFAFAFALQHLRDFFLYQLKEYLFMALDSILSSSVMLSGDDNSLYQNISGTGGQTSTKVAVYDDITSTPIFHISPRPSDFPIKSQKKKKVFTPFADSAFWCWDCLLSCLVFCSPRCFPLSSPVPLSHTNQQHFTAAALSQWIIYFDNINFYGHKLCFPLFFLSSLVVVAASLRHSRRCCLIFNVIFISNILAPAQLYDFTYFIW